ncbi:MAG TPA: glycosyl hydrolase [Bryobacteraceae bacterium]|nr:glycosyl hydrolase [Bryobacteraceae bacterium]
MPPLLKRLLFAIPAAALLAASSNAAGIADLHQAFEHPPDNARPMVRWWWFGPGVTTTELGRELRAMKAGGFGGAEVQPVYPMALDDPQIGFHNFPYLSDGFINALRFTNQTAHDLGLRIDLTLGSGWPYGGPEIDITKASARLRCDRVTVPQDATSIAMPYLENGEKLIAVFLAKGEGRQFSPDGIQQLAIAKGERLPIPSGVSGPHVVLYFISSRTGQQVKRPAINAEGFVLNHYDRAAIETHLTHTADRLMEAFGSNPPYAVFSDSLEVYQADWTPNMLEEFRKRRGYDLTPYLPALVGDIGDKTAAVRHDWGLTLSELADDNYLKPLTEWAHAHGTKFRSQTYGTPPVTMSSNALVDLPEGEGVTWRNFSATRWASSASHLYNRPVTSSETWTWLHGLVFRATPLDMKAEADLHFLQGINQLIGHGWPYSPPMAGYPGWHFYAAAVFNDNNPWWIVMPDITKYMQRVSFLLRQGKPANDVAIYLPTADVFSRFTNGRDTVNGGMSQYMRNVVPQVLDAGFNFDFIDDNAIASIGIPHPILILPDVERIPVAAYQKIEAYAQKGGIVVAVGRTPGLAPGLMNAERDTAQIRTISHTLFEGASAKGHLVQNADTLGKDLAGWFTPDVRFSAQASALGIVHRKVDSGEIYFIVNTTNQPVHTEATFRVKGLKPVWWNPFNGAEEGVQGTSADGAAVKLDLAPYESRVLVYSAQGMAAPTSPANPPSPIDLGSDWKVTLNGRTFDMAKLQSWTDYPGDKYYSGKATYEKTVSVPSAMTHSGGAVYLDFGPGTVVPPGRLGNGMRAWMESPVREAAQVYVNGTLAGPVWHPPYRVDVTKLLKPGQNSIRVVVANLALNALAGQSLPNYHLLNLRYGERFSVQGTQDIQALPSGILGPVKLAVE